MTALLAWVGELPQWFQMVFVSGLTSGVILTLVYFIRKGMGIRFKTRLGDVVVGADGKPVEKHPVIDAADVAMMLNEFMRVLTRKMEIKNFLMMRKQMNYAEERVDHGLMLMQGIYLDLLKKKGMWHVTESDSFRIYLLVLAAMKSRILHELRNAFSVDKFVGKDEHEFQGYVDTKAETMQAIITTTLNELYFYKEDITRDQLYTANFEEIQKLRVIVRDIYYFARNVALDYAAEMDDLDKSLEKIVEEVIGGKRCVD